MTTTGKKYHPTGDVLWEHSRSHHLSSDGLYRADERLGPFTAAAMELVDEMGARDALGGMLRQRWLFGVPLYAYGRVGSAIHARQLRLIKGCGGPERMLAATRALAEELTTWVALRGVR